MIRSTYLQPSLILIALFLVVHAGCHSVTSLPAGNAPNTSDLPEMLSFNASDDVAPATVCVKTAEEFQRSGHHEEAIALYGKAISHDPRLHDKLSRRLALLFTKVGRISGAKAEYKRALAYWKDDASLWNDYGYFLLKQKQYSDALSALQQATKLDPANQRAKLNVGIALAYQGQVDSAVQWMSPIIGEAAARFNTGSILARNGNSVQAAQQLRWARQLDPHLSQATTLLAQLDKTEPTAKKQR
ncbi:MAG: tetratricopeptide repeat protein [Pirellulaceae bacterium]